MTPVGFLRPASVGAIASPHQQPRQILPNQIKPLGKIVIGTQAPGNVAYLRGKARRQRSRNTPLATRVPEIVGH
jgi:hypothetical protein